MLSCLNASSSAVLIKPCWLFSMVDFLLIPRPCGKSGGAFPFLNKPPNTDRIFVSPLAQIHLSTTPFPDESKNTSKEESTSRSILAD